VVESYGTGAAGGCPACDQRDLDFARRYSLPVHLIVCPPGMDPATSQVGASAYDGDGTIINSGFLSGLCVAEAIDAAIARLVELGRGEPSVRHERAGLAGRHMATTTVEFGVFLGAAVLLAVTPGQGIAYVLARTMAGGRSEGLASALGTAVGGLVHVIAAALGLSALLAESAQAFAIVKYVGAGYLILLGMRTLRSSRDRQRLPELSSAGSRRAFFEGIVVETLNVKTALFFLAFIPQFIDPSASALVQFAVLGSICVALNTAADVAVVFGTAGVRASRPIGRLLTVGSGCSLIGLGAYVALAKAER
jgi:threonine/homoserine/homoserine lactone efflux protein